MKYNTLQHKANQDIANTINKLNAANGIDSRISARDVAAVAAAYAITPTASATPTSKENTESAKKIYSLQPIGIKMAYEKTQENDVKSNINWDEYTKAEDFSELSKATESKRKSGLKFWNSDDKYDFINDIDNYRLIISALSAGSGEREKYGNYTLYSHMNDKEVGIYNYLYAKEGKDKAEEYLSDITDTLNSRYGKDIYDNMTGIRKGLYWLPTGVDQWAGGIKQALSEKELPTSPIQYAGQEVQKEADEKSAVLGSLNKAGVMIGNMLPSILLSRGASSVLNGLGASAKVIKAASGAAGALSVGASSGGNAYGQALKEGYSKEQAAAYGKITGASEGLLQYLLGGISDLGGISSSKILGKVATIKNTWLKVFAKYGIQGLSEVTEEEAQLYLEPLYRKFIFGEEYEAPKMQEVLETALITMFTTGILNGGSDISRGEVTKVEGVTTQEAKVLRSEAERLIKEQESNGQKLSKKQKNEIRKSLFTDLQRGYIDIETIERALGEESYTAYQEAVKNKGENINELKKQLRQEVFNKVQKSKSNNLIESYRDLARAEQTLAIDDTKYQGSKNQDAVNKTIENARKAGLNNTNRTRDLFDLAVKASADKGLVFDFADNETLKATVEKQLNDRIEQLANIPTPQRTEAQSQELKNLSEKLTKVQSGKITVDGNITNNGITLNLNSERALNTIVGHEVTHSLEGTEHYKKLQDAIFEYAKTKKEYQTRLDALKERYKGIETTDEAILEELTSDLVGDYLFNDYNFVLNLATNHRNVFQKIFDEIKYLCKIATAGSKELRALEKAKHNFEKAYRETSDVTEARKNAFSIDEKGEKWYNETNRNTTKKGANDGREETNGNKNLYSRGSDKEALLGNDNRWRSISFSDVHGRTRRISEVLTKQKDKEKINSLAEDIYQRPRTETQDILVWHAKKEDINLFFLKMRSDEANEFIVDDNNLFIPENTTETSFVDILDTIKPIERNVDENKIAHISEERRDKFLSLFPDAYITRIPIQQFLDMTTESNVDQRQIYSASSKISQTVPVENIKNTSGEYMYLKVDVKNGEVISHEGRHRMTALLNAGNAYADIFVISDNARNESYKNLVVKGQFNEKKHTISLIKAKSERFATAIDNMFWRDDGNIRYALSNSVIDNDGDKGYNYTKGQYEQFGWAREANALSKNELDDLYSKIQARYTLRTFKRSSDGEAIIKVNNEPHTKLGVNNVFVFVKGTKNNFKISRVVRFDAQTEVEMEIYEEAIYERGTWSDSYLPYFEQEGFAKEYRREDTKSFEQYQQEVRRRSSGQESRGADQDNRGSEEHGSGHSQALGENGETNVRYSLSDEDVDGYNDDLYTTTDDFVREVIYYDRSAFDRSLANKTSDMKKGETRTIMILGATRNNLSRVYWFSADGYMHGKMISVEIIDDKKEIKRKEYKNGIDGDTKIVDLWNDSFSVIGGNTESDISLNENRREANLADRISTDTLESNRGRNSERSWSDYQIDKERTYEIIRKLRAMYGDPDTRHTLSDDDGGEYNLAESSFENGQDAIYTYKSSESYKINEALRNNSDLSDSYVKLIKRLDKQLEEIPTYEGVLYRNLSFDLQGQEALDDFVAMHIPGEIIKYPAYTSTSKSPDGYPIDAELAVHMKIYGINGHDISKNYGIESEEEVLFKRNSIFLVRSVSHDGKTANIIMEEINIEQGRVQSGNTGNISGKQGSSNSSSEETKLQQLQALSSRESSGGMQSVSERDTQRYTSRRSRSQGTVQGGQRSEVRTQGQIKNDNSDERFALSDADTDTADMSGSVGKKRTQYEASRIERIYTALDSAYIDTVDELYGATKFLSKVGKMKNAADIVQAIRASMSVAQAMIGDVQYDIMSDDAKLLGDGLSKIVKPITVKGDSVKISFNEYLMHWLNIDRMSLEEKSLARLDEMKSKLEGDVKKLREVNAKIAELKAKKQSMFSDAEAQKQLDASLEKYEGMAKALKKDVRAQKKQIDNFEVMKNKPVFDKNDERENAVTAEESRKRIAELEKAHPDFKETAEKLWAYTKNLNHMRVESGLISADSEAYMNELYPHYVPAYRDTKGGGVAAIKGRRNLAISSTVRRAKGSGLDVLDAIDSIASQTQEVVRAGRINQLFRKMYDIASNGEGAEYVEIVSREKVSSEQVANDSTKTELTAIIEVRPKGNQITGFVNGEKVTLSVSDEIFIAFDSMGKPTIDPTSSILQGAKRLNELYKKLLTSYSPAFLIRNPIKDIQDAGLNSKHATLFAKNLTKAAKIMFENGEAWQIYRAYGGYSASIFGPEGFSANVDSRGFEAMAKLFDSDEVTIKTVYEAAKKGGKNILVGINNLNAFVEQATRFAEYLASIEAGDSIPTAINNAAEVTTNFGRRGRLTKKLNATVMPFLNPAIQGFDKIFRNVGDAFKAGNGVAVTKALGNLFTKAALIGLAPILVNMLLYGDDDDYEKLRETDKENNFLIKVGDTFIKIPRGRLASVIGGSANRASKLIKGEDADLKDYAENVMNQVTPVGNLTRTIFSPFFDVKNNRTWYGSEIEGRQWDNTAPKDRYDESTSSIAIAIGKVINYSPKKIHYLLDQYSGVIGDFVLPMTSKKAHKDFFSGNFTIDAATSNKLSSSFYKIYDKAQYAKTAGDDTAIYQVKYLNQVKDAISKLHDEKQAIQNNSELSNVEKLQQSRVVQVLINQAYETALADFERYTQAFEATEGLENTSLFKSAFGAEATEATLQKMRYTEATRYMYGAKKALEEYNEDVYAKCELLNLAGVDYDKLYYYYFATKGLTSDVDKRGNVVSGSKKKKVIAEINKLGFSREQKLLLIASKGYSLTDSEKKRLLNYILKLKTTKEKRIELAELCGFEVKNGRIVTKIN